MYPVRGALLPTDGESAEEERTHPRRRGGAGGGRRCWPKSPSGDMLVFMPTEQDIRETCELIEGRGYAGASRCCRCSPGFRAPSRRRVFRRRRRAQDHRGHQRGRNLHHHPGHPVRGRHRPGPDLPLLAARPRTTALPVMPISRSSADQRMGRCGRVENGVCIRLLCRGGLPGAPAVHPAGDPALQPGRGHPAHDRP